MDEDTRNFDFLGDLFRSAEKGKTPLGRTAPFKFLDPYGPEDKGIYFGREFEVAEVYNRFFKTRILVVYGESGSGKTSLVQCGLRSEIPPEDAAFLTIRSASDPLEALERELAKYTGFGEDAPESLREMLKEAIFRKGKPLALLFDQFEEFFLFQPPSVREAFVRELAAWVEADLNIRVIFVIREEYLARMTELETVLPELLQNRIWVRRMSREQAKEVIISPCRACNVGIEEGLADALLDDLTRSGGVELPILQVVMDSLYRRAIANNPDSPSLTLSEYQEMGKVESILARFIEETVESHPQPERVRQVLKALVTSEGTKRISSLDQIIENAAPFGEPLDTETLVPILRSLIDRRVLREDADSRLYELRHDALAVPIRQWMTGLEQELVEVRQTLENRFKEYQHRGTVLDAQSLSWIAPYEARLRLNPDMRFFVETSKRAAVRRRRVALALAGAAVGVFVIIVTALGLLSYKKYLDSERNMGYVFTERARQSYEAQDYNAARLNSLYALTKLKGKDTETIRAEAAGYFTLSPEYPVVFDMPQKLPLKRSLTGLDFSPDGSTIALSEFFKNTVTLWDIHTGNLKAILTGDNGTVMRQRFSPDGNLIAACYIENRSVRIWDTRSFKTLPSIENLPENPWNVSFSRDGRQLAFGLTDGTVHIWDIKANKEVSKWKAHNGNVYMVVFSPDGACLASSSADGSVGLWNVQTWEMIIRFTGQKGTVWGLCFSPDGKTLASSAADGTIYIWNLASKELVTKLTGHNTIVWDVDFSPDGKLLVSVAEDLRFWNTSTWKQVGDPLPTGRGGKVRFSPDGGMVVSGGTLSFWDTKTHKRLKSVESVRVAFSPYDHFMYTGSQDGILRRWDLKVGRQASVWENIPGSVSCLRFDSKGNMIAIGMENGIIQVRDSKSGETIRTLSGHSGQIQCIAFSHNFEVIASASTDSTVRLWNLRSDKFLAFSGHKGAVNGVCFSPDGRSIYTCSDDGTIRFLNPLSGNQDGMINGSKDKLLSISISKDGAKLITVSSDHSISIWDTKTHELLNLFREDLGSPRAASFSSDGNLLSIGLESGTVTLWNIRSQERIAVFTVGISPVVALEFSPDGRMLSASSVDGCMRVWDISQSLKVTEIHDKPTNWAPISTFSNDGKSLCLNALYSSIFSIWDIPGGYRQITVRSPEGFYLVKFFPDIYIGCTAAQQGFYRVWNLNTGNEIASVIGKPNFDFYDFSPDGSLLIFQGLNNATEVWDVKKKRTLYTLPELVNAMFSQDGSLVASLGSDGWVKVLDLHSIKKRNVFKTQNPFNLVKVSDNHNSLAVMDSTRTIQIWDVWTSRKIATFKPISLQIKSLKFSWDCSRLLIRSTDGLVQVFDLKKKNSVCVFRVPAFHINTAIAISNDGSLVATAGSDHIIQFWSTNTGKIVGSIKGHSEDISDLSFSFSPNGSLFVTGDNSGLFHIWDMETISLLFSTPIQKLITQAESQSRLSMKRFLLEPDTSEPNLFGTPPKPPVWPERHPFYWLDRADKGDVNAMLKLGAIYERSGETDKALQWYQKAAQKGNAEGKKKLEALQTKFKTTSGNSK